jgi:hypothetical protein
MPDPEKQSSRHCCRCRRRRSLTSDVLRTAGPGDDVVSAVPATWSSVRDEEEGEDALGHRERSGPQAVPPRCRGCASRQVKRVAVLLAGSRRRRLHLHGKCSMLGLQGALANGCREGQPASSPRALTVYGAERDCDFVFNLVNLCLFGVFRSQGESCFPTKLVQKRGDGGSST